MSTKEDQSGNTKGPSRWVKSNLVALGSAAVLAVYSAGYARTRSAAERFAEESAERRPPERRVAPAASEAPSAPRLEAPTNAHVDSAAPVASSVPSTIAAAKPAASKPSAADSEKARPQIVTDTVSVPVPVKATEPATPVAPPAATLPAAPTTPPADSTTKSGDTSHVQLKDGTFSGWGTSRHGDIEAAVQIKDGRIVSSFIVQCLTRYSCSWISMLPGQVVTRQNAEVDYVSGATQSSNAFYYAIVEALSKAK